MLGQWHFLSPALPPPLCGIRHHELSVLAAPHLLHLSQLTAPPWLNFSHHGLSNEGGGRADGADVEGRNQVFCVPTSKDFYSVAIISSDCSHWVLVLRNAGSEHFSSRNVLCV